MFTPSVGLVILINFFQVSCSIDPSSLYSTAKEWRLSSDHNKFAMVGDYVHYKLYFPSEEHTTKTCLPSELNNKTASLFASAIDMSPVPNYTPRILSSSQVSFKKVDEVPQEISRNSTHFLHNQSVYSVPDEVNFTHPVEADTNTTEDKDDVIHEYLAIALVLPQHPFSRALVDSIRTVSPMFPSVTVYFGIASEFQGMCSQYGVRSFPTLLLFDKGLLVDKFKNTNGVKYKPEKLAQRLSRWTNQLPRSDPICTVHQLTTEDPYLEVQDMTALRYAVAEWFAHAHDFFSNMWRENVTISNILEASLSPWRGNFGSSIEPIISLANEPKAWDVPIYLLSAVYVFVRVIYCKMSPFQSDGVNTADANN